LDKLLFKKPKIYLTIVSIYLFSSSAILVSGFFIFLEQDSIIFFIWPIVALVSVMSVAGGILLLLRIKEGKDTSAISLAIWSFFIFLFVSFSSIDKNPFSLIVTIAMVVANILMYIFLKKGWKTFD